MKGRAHMKRAIFVILVFGLLWFSLESLAQFRPEEIAQNAKWEDFLKTANIVSQEQMSFLEDTARPWILTLEKDGVTQKAVWKDLSGMLRGFKESWKAEIAAYRLSHYLGLNMVPPTVEREWEGKKGACQLKVKYWKRFEEIGTEKLQAKGIQSTDFLRRQYLQRAFDNLIFNINRHDGNIQILEDWRIILVNHSRSLGTSKASLLKLIYDENNRRDKNLIMDELPRGFFEKLKSLDASMIKSAIGKYLTDEEINAILKRRDLIVAWIDKHIKEKGEAHVLF
jgi:hypothetical protein